MIVSHLLLILHKKIQFYIFMFEAWNVAKGCKVQGAEYFRKALYILFLPSQGTPFNLVSQSLYNLHKPIGM